MRIAVAAAALLVLLGVAWWWQSAPPAAEPNHAGMGSRRGHPPRTPSRVSDSPNEPSHPLLERTAQLVNAPRAVPTVVLRAPWGSGPGELGHHVDPESAPVGPMAIAVGPHGQKLALLDEVNERVVQVALTPQGARTIGTMALRGDTAQDLLIDERGRVAVLDRLGRGTTGVTLLSVGAAPTELPLVGPGISEAGGVTGLFTDATGSLYAEERHGDLVRIALADGMPDPQRQRLAGRPRRDGQALLSAAIADAAAGEVRLTARALDGSPLWSTTLQLPAPVLYLALVDSDEAGDSYVAAYVGREAVTPPYGITDAAIDVASVAPTGELRGTMVLSPSGAHEEIFREFAVGDDGTIYRLVDTPDGVVVERYKF